MDKREAEAVLETYNEIKRTMPILAYAPHQKQLQFHKAAKQYRKRLFCGANDSGKTTAGAAELVMRATCTHPYLGKQEPGLYWVVSVDFSTSTDVAERAIRSLLPPEGVGWKWHAADRVMEFDNGSEVKFKSCDSGRSKFQGARVKGIWFDEEPKKEIYSECLARRKAGELLDLWFTMTPIPDEKDGKRMSWTYKDLYMRSKDEGSDVFSVNVSLDDNEYLSKEEISELKSNWTGAEYRIRALGEYTLLTGQGAFDTEALEWYQNNCKDPKRGSFFEQGGHVKWMENNGVWKVWEHPHRWVVHQATGIREMLTNAWSTYSIGVDSSYAVGRDRAAAVVLKNSDLSVVAVLHGQFPPDILAEHVAQVAKYYNDALIVPESNACGLSLIDCLKRIGSRKIIHKYILDENGTVKLKKLGWWTDKRSKMILVSDLAKLIRQKKIAINDSNIVSELMTFLADQDTFGAEDGYNDDLVIALGLAIQGAKYQGAIREENVAKRFEGKLQRKIVSVIGKR